jgi:hypothetical protein
MNESRQASDVRFVTYRLYSLALRQRDKPIIIPKDIAMKLSKDKVFSVLVNQVQKCEKARVASYGIRVADAMNRAEERLIEAQKALRAAEKVVQQQAKALKVFKKTGDSEHLNVFGV